MISCQVIDFGLSGYAEVLELQEQLFNKNIEAKLKNEATQNYLILCEHKPVFTLGKSGKRENILVNDDDMKADFFRVNRGGDVTFHGPGQLVVYPILDLELLHIGLAQYVFKLEEVIIDTLDQFGIKAERIEDAAGIWLRPNDRKIAAIGIKSSRGITMHGLAVNISTDLSYFDKIVPCGLIDKGTTSIQNELKEEVAIENYKKIFLQCFLRVFNFTPST